MKPLSIVCLALLPLLGGCQELPHEPRGHDVEVLGVGDLAQANPGDVVVAPLVLTEGAQGVPERALRAGFQKALVQRRYSPLALEAVDSHAVDAAYHPGELREDAVLEVTVERWNGGLWSTSEQIDSTLRARLVDARGSGRVLWEGRLARTLHAYEVTVTGHSKEELLAGLCDLLAGDLLAALPLRTVSPAQ